MITEDYVSFETAKLLKEKGFEGDNRDWYTPDGFIEEVGVDDGIDPTAHEDIFDSLVPAPTLQMAAKWLRTKNIFIDIYHYNSKIAPFIWRIFAYNILMPQTAETFEEAAEASINYVLKHWDEVNMALDDYYKYDKMLPKIW